jgi:hypothetical protein
MSTIVGVRGITVRKVGQHGFADRIDPVCVLDDEQRRLGACQRRGVDQCGQSAPSCIRIDLRQRQFRIGDAEQVIEQQQILRVDIGRYDGA